MATQEEINRASQIESEASKQTTESHGWVIEVSQVPEVGGRSDLVGLWFAVAWIAGTVYAGERPIGS